MFHVCKSRHYKPRDIVHKTIMYGVRGYVKTVLQYGTHNMQIMFLLN